jgi:hypothetical protein
MGKELYNNKSNIENVSKILGDLPKVGAPDNFEYNLMTRIQNKNFDTAGESAVQRSKFSWIFAPASVVATTIVIMFFVFDFQKIEPENLLMSEPQKRNELTAGLASKDVESKKIAESTASLEKSDLASNSQPSVAKEKNEEADRLDNVVGGSYAAKSEKRVVLPFNDNDAIDLDSYISGGRNSASMNSRGLTVGGGGADPGFEGFMIQIHDAQLNELKAKMDSLFNAMKDSLNSNINN